MIFILILLIVAFVLFLLAGIGVPSPPRVNLLAWGLACWVLAEILTRGGLLH